MTILISNRSRRAVPTCEMSDEQAGSLNKAGLDFEFGRKTPLALVVNRKRGPLGGAGKGRQCQRTN